MKTNKTKASLPIASALLGISTAASAQQLPSAQFIPLEKLHPQDRAFFVQKLRELEGTVKIDWKTVIAGVDENGQIVLKNRKHGNIDPVANPSCWTEAKTK